MEPSGFLLCIGYDIVHLLGEQKLAFLPHTEMMLSLTKATVLHKYIHTLAQMLRT